MTMVILCIGLLGLALGSFFNVVIHRVPERRSLVRPGSACPACGHPVRWYDNVPLLGFLLLRGRCRDCHAPISWRYPLVELLTALGFLALYWRFGLTLDFGRYALLLGFLVPIAFIDWDRKLILNRLTLPGMAVGLLYTLFFEIAYWKTMLLGGVAGGAVLLVLGLLGNLLFKKESLGMGDVKMLVFTGIYLGFPQVLYGLFLGMVAAAVYIVVGLATRRLGMGKTIPFGPFIAIGALGQILFGETILQWYLGFYR